MFSKLERLVFGFNQTDCLLFLLQHLPKLSHIKVGWATNDFYLQLDKLGQKEGLWVFTTHEDEHSGPLSLCIERKI